MTSTQQPPTRTALAPGEQRFHQHPEAGAFAVRHFFGDHPRGLPYFCCGLFCASEQEAIESFYSRCSSDERGPSEEANHRYWSGLEAWAAGERE